MLVVIRAIVKFVDVVRTTVVTIAQQTEVVVVGEEVCSPLNMVLQMAALLVSVRLLGSTLMVSYCGAALSNV